MSAYNSVNGEWCGQNRALLTDVLRQEWGFEGFVISDWIFGLRDAATSVAAGLDVEMPYRMVRATHLPRALDEGEVSWDEVSDAVVRIVSTLLRFDGVLSAPAPERDVVDSAPHRELARLTAARSVVLLRNEGVNGAGSPLLPLSAGDIGSVAVVGRLAGRVNLGDGGSSDVWALDCSTVLDGIRSAVGDGVEVTDDPAGADVAIVVVGYTYLDEGEYIGATSPDLASLFPPADEPDVVERFNTELANLPETVMPESVAARPSGGFATGGDRTSLRLPPEDVDLIRAVAAANPRTVVVVQGGSAVVVSEWIDSVPAVVQAWYGGSEAGTGLADVLFGAENPSARLPLSVPADEAHLPPFDRDAERFVYDRWHGWWHLRREGRRPAFPFGFGLSYTSFELGEVDVDTGTDAVVVSGSVANTGDRDGADVIQVYADLPDPDAPPRLVGFARVDVPAHGTASFMVRVALDRLTTRDPVRHAWTPPTGPHRFVVARHACDDHARVITIDL
jgi:beta-glucosidase